VVEKTYRLGNMRVVRIPGSPHSLPGIMLTYWLKDFWVGQIV